MRADPGAQPDLLEMPGIHVPTGSEPPSLTVSQASDGRSDSATAAAWS